MEKIDASKLIHPDDDFVKALHEKLKVISERENDGLKKFDTHEAAKYCRASLQTIQIHIKNYVRQKEGKQLKAHKKEGKHKYTILKQDLDQYLKNPKETL